MKGRDPTKGGRPPCPHASGKSGLAGALRAPGRGALPPWRAGSARCPVAEAFAQEWDERRPFLWLPVAAGAGVFLYLAADREPVLWLPLVLLGLAATAAALLRAPARAPRGGARRPGPRRRLRLGRTPGAGRRDPDLDRIRIVQLAGTVEEIDLRPAGARLLVSVESADGLDAADRPRRVRVTADATRAASRRATPRQVHGPAAAARPGRPAGRLRFRPRRLFLGDRRRGLGARPASCRSRRGEDRAGRPDLHRAIDRARNALARGSTRSWAAATPARSRPPW